VVVPSIFKLVESSALTPNHEVASYEWASLGELVGEEARSSHLIPKGGVQVPFPCIVHRGLVIWGMTERILSEIIGGGRDAATTGLQGKSGWRYRLDSER
jgi:hypothetical protein